MTNSQKYKTAEGRARAFNKYCDNNSDSHGDCKLNIQCHYCHFVWLDSEAEEDEEPLPCPLCGARMGVSGTFLKCTGCGLGFSYGLTTNDVTSAFNRVARAVMKEKEGDK